MTERVPERLTDERTEVGQVGAALNTLLEHVESSLAARHRSEQQVRQFVADASHELRTPLATIHGYAELSRRTPDDPAALSNALTKVETETDRMSTLVDDLLLLARLDSGRPLERSEVDITRLLLESVGDARVLAPQHRWQLRLPDEPVTVTGDEQRLHQVVTNLLGNARHHTPPGTTVTVSAEPRADGITIQVHDDGPGLPARSRGPRLRAVHPRRHLAHPRQRRRRAWASRWSPRSCRRTAGRPRCSRSRETPPSRSGCPADETRSPDYDQRVLLEREQQLDDLDRLRRRVGHRRRRRRRWSAAKPASARPAWCGRSRAGSPERVLTGACEPLTTPRPLQPLHDIAHQTGGRLAALIAERRRSPRAVHRAPRGPDRRAADRGGASRTCTGPTRPRSTCSSSSAGGSPTPRRSSSLTFRDAHPTASTALAEVLGHLAAAPRAPCASRFHR